MAVQEYQEEVTAAVQWLKGEAPRRDLVPQRELGTCEWILSKKQYQWWMETKCKDCLWIHGIPGKMHRSRLIDIDDGTHLGHGAPLVSRHCCHQASGLTTLG